MHLALTIIALLCMPPSAIGRDLNFRSELSTTGRPLASAFFNTSTEATNPAQADSQKLASTATPEANKKNAFGWFADQTSALRSVFVDFLILSLLGAFVLALIMDLRRKTVIIDSIVVPEALAKKGYTSDVVAQWVASEISALQRDARIKARREENFELSGAQIDFTVPNAGISYRAIVRYVRQLVGRPEERVQGEIVSELGAIRMILRTRDRRRTPTTLSVQLEREMPDLLKRAAFEIASLVDPYLIANYRLWTEQKEGKFTKTFDAVRICLEQTPADQHHRSYIVWANALFFQRQFDQAEEKYRTAARLAPRFASTYNSWGNLLRARRRLDDAETMYQTAIWLDRKHVYAWGNLGNVCNDRHLYRAALRMFSRALRLDPRFAGALSSQGYALWKLGRHSEAAAKFSRAIDLDPNMGWSYLNWAQMLRFQHRYEEAIAKVSLATDTAVSAQAFGIWGDILVDMGRFDEADEKYRSAIEADSSIASGYAGQSSLLRRRRRYKEAVGASKQALAIDCYYPGALGNLAEALRQSEEYDAAIESYQKLIALDSYQASAYVGWGQVLRNRHQLPEAIAKFRQATKVDSADSWSWRSWGEALFEMHRYEAGISKFRKALGINPWDSYSYIQWGKALAAMGNHAEALSKYRRALEVDYRSFWVLRRLADTLIDLGRRKEALAVYECASPELLQQPEVLVQWGQVLAGFGRLTEAHLKYDQALQLNREYPEALISKANVLRRLGHRIEALQLVRQAVKVDPGNEWARRTLGTLLQDLERGKVALRWFSRAHRQAPESATILLDWSDVLTRQARDYKGKDEKKRLLRIAQAEEKIRLAIYVDRWNTAALHKWGHRLLELGRPNEALEKFTEAVHRDPCAWLAMAGKGDAQRRLKSFAKAVAQYRRALVFRPNDANLLNDLGDALQKLGQTEQAIASFRRATEIEPETSRHFFSLADALRPAGRPKEAIDYYRQMIGRLEAGINYNRPVSAFDIKSLRLQALNGWGLALLQLADHLDAANKFHQVLSIDPNNQIAKKGLADAQKAA